MAGTTGAVMYVIPQFSGTMSVNGKGGAVLYLVPRMLSGIFNTGGGVSAADNLTTLKAWLPSSRTPVAQADGAMTPSWYRFFDYLVNQKLGGAEAPSITDVTNSVVGAQVAVTQVVGNVAGLTEQASQNASSLAATIEVAKTSTLPGAQQIPPVQLIARDPNEQAGVGAGGSGGGAGD